MELKKQKLILSSNRLFFLICLLFVGGCKKQNGKSLECILSIIDNKQKNVSAFVSQLDGWNDSLSLIIISYVDESKLNSTSHGNSKGEYISQHIYFDQSRIDTSLIKKYNQISNDISWSNIDNSLNEEVMPAPYDPITLQIEYNSFTDCFGEIIKGKEYLNKKLKQKCSSCLND